MNDQIKPLYDLLAGHFTFLPALLAWLGALKLFFHFVGPWIQGRLAAFVVSVAASSDQKDDHYLVLLLGSTFYSVTAFILRLASLPLPTIADYNAAKARASTTPSPAAIVGSLAMACVLPFLFVGCETGVEPGSAPITLGTNGLVSIGTFTVNTNDAYIAIHVAATFGAQQAIKADTNSIPYLRIVDAVLTTAVASQQYDPNQIQTAIDSISIKEVRGNPDVANGINMTLQLYRAFFGHVVDQHLSNASPYLDPALRAVRDGITDALLTAAATATQ